MKSVVPAVKALLAQKLVIEHGLKQDKVAEILGVSQSAVSKYAAKVRGYVIEVDKLNEIQPLVSRMITMLMDGDLQRMEFLELFCQTCTMVRRTGLVCQFCRKSDPNIKIERCGYCSALTMVRDGR